MPRPQRLDIPGVPQHIAQRGNNRQDTFYDDWDKANYLAFLKDACDAYDTSLHAYVLMTNHVHLLVTTTQKAGLSKTMQCLNRRYVMYFNSRHKRTGTLWEGRFKSSLVDGEKYCLICYRYIELNPVRARMVERPLDYRWSSYQRNGFGKPDPLITEHEVYSCLGQTALERRAVYRRLVESELTEEQVEHVRHGVRKGLPVGTKAFRKQVESALNIRLGTGRPGRPTNQIN